MIMVIVIIIITGKFLKALQFSWNVANLSGCIFLPFV